MLKTKIFSSSLFSMEEFMTCRFIVYNVKLGQCIGVLPVSQQDYAMVVDCGHDDLFHPIDDFK